MANPVAKMRLFLDETVAELKRSAWPTRKELVDSTIMVLVTMVLLGLFVAGADVVFLKMVQLVTGGF